MTLPSSMTAVEITANGGPEVLQPATVPVPTPKAGEILIKVAFAGVNRPDALQRAGAYNPPPDASPFPVSRRLARWLRWDRECRAGRWATP